MKNKLSSLLRFGPYLFYAVELVLWSLASLLVFSTNYLYFPGSLVCIAWPLFGLFIIGSIIAHTLFVSRQQSTPIRLLLAANALGIVGLWALIVLLHRLG